MESIKSEKNIVCEITFIVERDGSVSTIKASGDDESFNTEALIAVSKIEEKWIPAEINGQKVRSRYRVPLNITYSDDGETAKFPAGEDIFKKMVVSNLKIKNYTKNKICIISFAVDEKGRVRNIDVEGKSRKFNKDVEQAVSQINETWIPKMFRGTPIPSHIEINFEIN